jgi:hypothetical protein
MVNVASCRRATVIALLGAALAPVACKKSPPPPASQSASAQPPDTTGQPTAENPPSWLDHPQASPGTTVLTAIDPHTLRPSEVQFGVAPKRGAGVDYVPGVIVMENGDRAIRSVARDGMSWTFDANAPNVSDFQEGKVVFATGRAVGRILALKHDGNTVTAILGPVELTDVIQNGRFIMDQAVDPDKMIAYVAPDYPGLQDSSLTKTASLGGVRGGEESVVVSRMSHGRWIPTSMSHTGADGRRVSYRRRGRRWTDAQVSDVNQWTGAAGVGGLSTLGIIEPVAGGAPTVPNVQSPLPAPQQVLGAVPSLSANDGNLRLQPTASNSGVGLQYYYNTPSGVSATAYGTVMLHTPSIRCVLVITNRSVDSAGISIKGSAGVKLHLDSHSPTGAFVNMHAQHWVPVDFSIPLGGPVPFALTFATMFNVNSGFSARSTVMTAEGEYSFEGQIWAGHTKGDGWSLHAPTNVKTVTDLTQSLNAIGLGITSFTMAFSIRTLVGIGAFGFNVGVYASVRFGGSLLHSPTEAFLCRQTTLEANLDTGIGWQTPGFVVAAINIFLKPITGHAIDAVGDITAEKPFSLFHYLGQNPSGCASAKKT